MNIEPIPMLLFCPRCDTQHVDRDESPSDRDWSQLPAGEREKQYWTNPPHRTHLCHSCGYLWRVCDVPTVGVRTLQTKGKDDRSPHPWVAKTQGLPPLTSPHKPPA